MTPKKILLLGATGYIGGDALHALTQTHPDYEITALVRDENKAKAVSAAHPQVKVVLGELDNAELLEKEAGKVDIVLNCATSDHPSAATALLRGLNTSTNGGSKYLIHTSGTAIILNLQETSPSSAKIYDDITDISTITSFPDEAIHRDMDKIVLAGQEQGVKVAVACPPTVYGMGRGTGKKVSMQIPMLIQASLQAGHAFKVKVGEKGEEEEEEEEEEEAKWSHVFVGDLSDLFTKLVECAVEGKEEEGMWGPQAYYFAESGEHGWGEVAGWIAAEAKEMGLLKEARVKSLEKEEVRKMHPWGPELWGLSSRSRASRARKVSGWKPRGPGLRETVREAVEVEGRIV